MRSPKLEREYTNQTVARLLEDARTQARMARDKYGEAEPTPLDDAFMSLVRAVDALNAAVVLLDYSQRRKVK